jgi:hypothetical protein
MTKTTIALAALVAAITAANTAHADGVRVGFGFPLGSFVAHSNESYSARDVRQAESPRYARRDLQDDAPARKVVKVKKQAQPQVAEAVIEKPVLQETKREDMITPAPSKPATEKTTARTDDAALTKMNTASAAKISTAEDTSGSAPAAAKKDSGDSTSAAETKHVCRRYSPAIAALVDVPCE